MKGKQKIVCLTAYDAPFGRLADLAGVDVILVGDSLGNVVLGFADTLPVTLDAMEHHTAAVRRGVREALLVADMPFGSYGSSVAQGVDSAVSLMRAGAEGVKLEGDHPDTVAALVNIGVPVMGHVGLTPQSINAFGGHRVQGKTDGAVKELIARVKRLEEAGVFSIVLELVPATVGRAVTEAASVPIIGIGAGPSCDGEIQVMHDLLGLSEGEFKHARRFADVGALVGEALCNYAEAVRVGTFPAEENSF
jgi:3-methyl-2-oxobutanoate hydroxymethyltransferase